MRLGPEWAFDIVLTRLQWMAGREIWTWASLTHLENPVDWWAVLIMHEKMNPLPEADD